MSKLIRANLTRLLRDKFFWILNAVALAFGIFVIYNQHRAAQEMEVEVSPDSIILGVFAMVGIFIAIFAPLFIGTEYSDGTMRNKLVVGAKRVHIYLANFISMAVCGLIIEIVYLAIIAFVGTLSLGSIEVPIVTMPTRIAIGTLLTIALAAIFTLIAMMVTSKAVSAIICLLLAVTMMSAATSLCQALAEPEFYEGMVFSGGGGDVVYSGSDMQNVEKIPNPKYIPTEQRPFIQTIVDIIPAGQAQQLPKNETSPPWKLMLYSTMIIVITSGAGILVFRKKDLK